MQQDDPQLELASTIVGLLCCAVMAVGAFALLVWLARKAFGASKPVAAVATTVPAYLSVLALSVHASVRPVLEAAAQAPAHPDPLAARHALLQQLSQALLGLEHAWQDFGYGERDLGDLTATRESFFKAVTDFRTRGTAEPDGGALLVVTLILATRAPVLGVDRLDSRASARSALQARMQLSAVELLGAEVVLTPSADGLSEAALRARFPEMMRLIDGP
jgi:uncharacterized membrane protein